MNLHPTTAMLLAEERRRDLERAVAARPRSQSVPSRPRRLRGVLRRAAPALSRTT